MWLVVINPFGVIIWYIPSLKGLNMNRKRKVIPQAWKGLNMNNEYIYPNYISNCFHTKDRERTLAKNNRDELYKYIKEEYLQLLKEHQIEFDEKIYYRNQL